MQHRHRLRSRIIVSFAVFGFALTALFAISAIYLRGYLEDKLIGEALMKNVNDYAAKFHQDPNNEFLTFQKIAGYVYSERKFPNVPFAWRNLGNGVHDLTEPDGKGGSLVYKLAVHKEPKYWFFLKYDTTQDRHSQRLLEGALIFAVLGFFVLSLFFGFWLSARVMSPVSNLAALVQSMGKTGRVKPLAPHFADDEVGQLAAALDNYSDRLTALVERDREFNADISHELRTPLAVISTTTELLLGANNVPEKVRESIIGQIPAGRLGEPEEIARCVAFLAADDAGFINGSTISANGAQFLV